MISVPEAGPMAKTSRPIGIGPKRVLHDEAHHLPVAGDGVLSRRALGHATPRAGGRRFAARHRERPEEAEPVEVRQPRRRIAEDVAEGVRSGVAVLGGVGELADAEGVADDDDGALGGHERSGVRMSWTRGRRGGGTSAIATE
jgi:hypothetical protein